MMVAEENIGSTRRRYESVAAMIVGTHTPVQLVDEVQSGIDARKELDELKAKLPVTADGVPVVPGMTVYWRNITGDAICGIVQSVIQQGWLGLAIRKILASHCYSTREAAEAAGGE